MRFRGTFTAMITPFKNEEVDLEGLKENIAYQIENGIDGIVVLGTTGESTTLTPEEQVAVIKASVHQSIPVIVGTGTSSTRATIERTLQAQELGADAALIITPYYNKPTQEGIFLHYEAIAKAVSLPIIVYNNKPRTSVNIEVETMKRIASLPNISAVKEASGDLKQAKAFVDILPVFCGNDDQTLQMIHLGAEGTISVVSNIIPHKFSEFVREALSGNDCSDRELSLIPLLKALSLETNPIPIKTAMKLFGFPAGKLRLPLTEMSPEHHQILTQVIKEGNYGMDSAVTKAGRHPLF